MLIYQNCYMFILNFYIALCTCKYASHTTKFSRCPCSFIQVIYCRHQQNVWISSFFILHASHKSLCYLTTLPANGTISKEYGSRNTQINLHKVHVCQSQLIVDCDAMWTYWTWDSALIVAEWGAWLELCAWAGRRKLGLSKSEVII